MCWAKEPIIKSQFWVKNKFSTWSIQMHMYFTNKILWALFQNLLKSSLQLLKLMLTKLKTKKNCHSKWLFNIKFSSARPAECSRCIQSESDQSIMLNVTSPYQNKTTSQISLKFKYLEVNEDQDWKTGLRGVDKTQILFLLSLYGIRIEKT